MQIRAKDAIPAKNMFETVEFFMVGALHQLRIGRAEFCPNLLTI